MNESKNEPAQGDDQETKEVDGHSATTPTQKPGAPETTETTVPRDNV